VVRGKKRKKHPPPANMSKTYHKLYGKYQGKLNIVAKVAIFPIYGCTFKIPLNFTQETNKYTEKGRQLIHTKLQNGLVKGLILYLLNQKDFDKSARLPDGQVEFNDNRISLIAGQQGKCGITGEPLDYNDMQCHHKLPKHKGGTDEYKNLIWVCGNAHKLIHATHDNTIQKYLILLKLDLSADRQAKKGLKR